MVELVLDSHSVGEPSRFLSLSHLERSIAGPGTAPKDEGKVVQIVRRAEGGRRENLDEVELTPGEGLPGDAWGRKEAPNPETQLAVVQADVASLVANGQPFSLFGDNLFLDLDLSSENLPSGSRLRAGEALLQVTPIPHNGCRKFLSRFGPDALKFVSKKELRHRNLRGVYMRVIQAGLVRVGDAVHVLSRGEP